MNDKFKDFNNIDTDFYRSYYQDLSDLSPEVAIYHYENYGKHENRIINKIQLFYKTYPEFDVDFYKNYYQDLTHLSNEVILYHYDNYGKHENRLINKKQHFIQSYPDFDVDFYKTTNRDLYNMTNEELFIHYDTFGKNEQLRFLNGKEIREEDFCTKYFENLSHHHLNVFNLLKHITIINSLPFNNIKNCLSSIKHYNKNDKINNFNLQNLYLSWFNNSMNNRQISIVSPITNKIIYTNKYFIVTNPPDEDTKYSVCNYYFENEKIILGLGLGTGNHPQEACILYVYVIGNNNVLYDWHCYSFEKFKNNFIKRVLYIFYSKVKYTNFDEIDNKITTIYGFMNNMGHMLFNDYTGLYLLDYHNVTTKIEEVIFGPYDVYNIKEYFKQNNICTTDLEKIELKNYCIGKGLLFKYNHNYILDNTITFLKNNLIKSFPNDYESEKSSIENIKTNYYPIINITLRKGDFEMNNQANVISSLIKIILKKYPNAFFYLDGFVKNNSDYDSTLGINFNQNINNIRVSYLKLVEEIQNNINTNNCLSLINKNILHVVSHLSNCNYAIYILGSAACNGGWVCKIPGVQFGRPSIKIYKEMDEKIRENNPNIIYFDNENFISYDYKGNFNITADTIFKLIPKF